MHKPFLLSSSLTSPARNLANNASITTNLFSELLIVPLHCPDLLHFFNHCFCLVFVISLKTIAVGVTFNL